MAIKVKHITPKFSVKIVNSKISSTNGIPPVVYSGDSNSPTSPLTQAIASLNVIRRMGNPGRFDIVLYPNKPWHVLLNPMDYVEIAVSDPDTGNFIPIMRGFIDSITREFNIASGTPGFFIMIQGTDWSKLANYPLYWFEIVPNSSTIFFQNIIQKWNAALKGVELQHSIIPPTSNVVLTGPTNNTVTTAKNQGFYKPTELIQAIYSGFYLPIAQEIATHYATPLNVPALNLQAAIADPLESQLETFHPLINIESDTAESGLRTTIWDLFVRYQNRPWRELYFDDFFQDATYGTNQTIVYRPTPWQDINGSFLQPLPNSLDFALVLTDDDIMSYNLTRSDLQVANFFMTKAIISDQIVQLQASTQAPIASLTKGNPISLPASTSSAIVPSDWRIFGNRAQQWQCNYLDHSNTENKTQFTNRTVEAGSVAGELNQIVSEAFGFGEFLENGFFSIAGNPNFHIGRYIQYNGQYHYVEEVRHSFRQPGESMDGHFLTTLGVTRGRDVLYQQKVTP